MPMEKSLVYNRYVLDDEFVLDSIELSLLDEQRMKFIKELKRYNLGEKKRSQSEIVRYGL